MSTNQRHSKGVLFIVIAGVLWGTIGVAVKYLYTLTPSNALGVLYYRFLFALPVLVTLLFVRQKRKAFTIPRKPFFSMLLMGGMLAFSQLCYFVAIREAGVAVATLIAICVAPIVVALVSVFLFKEPLKTKVVVALTLSVVGVVLLIDLDGAVRLASLRGVLIALASAITFAIVVLASRSLAAYGKPLQVNTVAIAFGTLILTPFVASTGISVDFTPVGWMLLVYLGVVTTALAYWLLVLGTGSVRATTASVLTLIDPLVAAILAFALFGERLGATGLLGGAALVTSFIIISRH
jgi:drug/metabolite transporter, DME family